MDTTQAILDRHACRDFLDEQITDEQRGALIQAANAAPAGMGDYSGIRLTVIQNEALRAEIERETARGMPMMGAHPTYGAPTLMLISVRVDERLGMIAYCNAACMAENIMVQATALGLGSVLIMAVPAVMQSRPALLERLHIAGGLTPVVMVAVGKARDGEAPERGERISYEIL